MDPAGDQVIPGALGGAFGQEGGFDIHETLLVQEAADGASHLVTEADIGKKAGPSEVQEAVLEPEVLPHVIGVGGIEGQRGAGREQFGLPDPELDGARRDPGVHGLLVAPLHKSPDQDHGLVADPLGEREGLRLGVFGIENGLEQALPVSEIDEDHAPHITFGLNPAAGNRLPAHVFFREKSAIVCPFHTLEPNSRP